MITKMTVILSFLVSLSAASADPIESLQAKDVDISLGPGVSGTIELGHLSVERGEKTVVLENSIMDVFWHQSQILIRDESRVLWLPFIDQTVNNRLNQYYVENMDMDYLNGERIQTRIESFKIATADHRYRLGKIFLLCKKEDDTVVSTTLDLCLTHTATITLSSLKFNQPVMTRFLRTLSVIELPIVKPAPLQNNFLKKSSISIKKNRWELKTVFKGNSIAMNGSVHYDTTNDQIHIDIFRATTSFIIPVNIKSRVYRQLYSIKSDLISVAPNNGTITINLSHF